ncbi:unnamed protein product [Parajaminaea phylloscopi]
MANDHVDAGTHLRIYAREAGPVRKDANTALYVGQSASVRRRSIEHDYRHGSARGMGAKLPNGRLLSAVLLTDVSSVACDGESRILDAAYDKSLPPALLHDFNALPESPGAFRDALLSFDELVLIHFYHATTVDKHIEAAWRRYAGLEEPVWMPLNAAREMNFRKALPDVVDSRQAGTYLRLYARDRRPVNSDKDTALYVGQTCNMRDRAQRHASLFANKLHHSSSIPRGCLLVATLLTTTSDVECEAERKLLSAEREPWLSKGQDLQLNVLLGDRAAFRDALLALDELVLIHYYHATVVGKVIDAAWRSFTGLETPAWLPLNGHREMNLCKGHVARPGSNLTLDKALQVGLQLSFIIQPPRHSQQAIATRMSVQVKPCKTLGLRMGDAYSRRVLNATPGPMEAKRRGKKSDTALAKAPLAAAHPTGQHSDLLRKTISFIKSMQGEEDARLAAGADTLVQCLPADVIANSVFRRIQPHVVQARGYMELKALPGPSPRSTASVKDAGTYVRMYAKDARTVTSDADTGLYVGKSGNLQRRTTQHIPSSGSRTSMDKRSQMGSFSPPFKSRAQLPLSVTARPERSVQIGNLPWARRKRFAELNALLANLGALRDAILALDEIVFIHFYQATSTCRVIEMAFRRATGLDAPRWLPLNRQREMSMRKGRVERPESWATLEQTLLAACDVNFMMQKSRHCTPPGSAQINLQYKIGSCLLLTRNIEYTDRILDATPGARERRDGGERFFPGKLRLREVTVDDDRQAIMWPASCSAEFKAYVNNWVFELTLTGGTATLIDFDLNPMTSAWAKLYEQCREDFTRRTSSATAASTSA